MMCGAYFEKLQQLTKEEIEKMSEELYDIKLSDGQVNVKQDGTYTITTSGGTGYITTACNSSDGITWTIPPTNNGMKFVIYDDAELISMDELGDIGTLHYKFAELSENFFDNYFEEEYEDHNWYEDEAFNLGCFARSARNYKDKRIGALMND